MKTIAFFLALIAVVAAYGHGSSYVSRSDHNTPVHGHSGGHDDHKDYYHHPSYKYEYGVHDPKTKDKHSAWEHRDGDDVHGEYTLDEADGTVRKVSYTSSKHEGFNAKVEKIGHAHHPEHYGHHDEHHY